MSTRRMITALCPHLDGNSLVRSVPIIDSLRQLYDVQVLGFLGEDKEVFGPFRDRRDFQRVVVDKRRRLWPRFWGAIREMAQRVEGSLVYVFKPFPSTLLAGNLARRRLRCPLLVDVEDWDACGYFENHGFSARYDQIRSIRWPYNDLWLRLGETLVKTADAVTVVSSFLQKRHGGEIVYHGPNTSLYDPAVFDTREVRQKLRLSQDVCYLLFAGEAWGHKGVTTVCQAVAALGRQDVRVLLLGSETPMVKKCVAIAPGLVEYRGMRPYHEMPLWLAAADIVPVLQADTPYARAQIPGKMLDAAAMGKAILATPVGDVPVALGDGAAFCGDGSVDSVAPVLRRLVEDRGWRQQLGSRARARAVECFGHDAIRRRIVPIVERLVND